MNDGSRCGNMVIRHGVVFQCQTPASVIAKRYKDGSDLPLCTYCLDTEAADPQANFLDCHEVEAIET